jgi:hypothetical protein
MRAMRAGGRLEEVREQVEAGGLAGAVGADERVDTAPPHLQGHILDCYETLELLGKPARFENRFVDQPATSRPEAADHTTIQYFGGL